MVASILGALRPQVTIPPDGQGIGYTDMELGKKFWLHHYNQVEHWDYTGVMMHLVQVHQKL